MANFTTSHEQKISLYVLIIADETELTSLKTHGTDERLEDQSSIRTSSLLPLSQATCR